jgi:uncharacterized protein YndB with AHSA1/START domain
MPGERSDRNVLRVERVFDAPIDAVFDAWLSVDALKLWWPAGADWDTPVAEVDPRVGGRLRLVMRTPDGEEYGGSGSYVEIDRPRRLVFTWAWDTANEEEQEQLVEVEFIDRRDGTTQVLLTNRGLPDRAARDSHREGWLASFENLDGVLAGGSRA